jgi:undecaprenyl-diphosphatase
VDAVRAIVLGIIEGLTEFLPVSSTGHMLIAMPLLGVDEAQPVWRTLLWVSQLGAILAVIVYFWRDLWQRTFHPTSGPWTNHIVTKLVAAMIPTIVLALLLNDWCETHLSHPVWVALALVLGAGAMEYVDRRCRRRSSMEIEDVTLPQAVLIGVIQCISMWPGVSRAAASILGGMALGLTPRVATEFSFYLAIPTMLAAGAKTLWEYRHDLGGPGMPIVLIGTATAFAVALLVIAGFLSYVRRRRFTPFAIYRVALGAAVLAFHALC